MSTPSSLPDVALRPMRLGDVRFVRANWLRSYAPHAGLAPGLYFDRWGARIKSLLFSHDCLTTVACDPEHEDVLFGFVTVQEFEDRRGLQAVLHYCYVKPSLRRNGIARLLCAAYPGGFHSHRTPDATKLQLGRRYDHTLFFGVPTNERPDRSSSELHYAARQPDEAVTGTDTIKGAVQAS